MLTYPHIDPVAIHIGLFAVRWYALAYLAGVLGGWWLVGVLNRRLLPPTLTPQAFDDIMVYAIFGIILGGRFGYILFYKPDYYFAHPAEMLKVWQGGMSFHGGLIGTILAMALFCARYKASFLRVTDLLAVAAPIGLCLGRLANFVNGELYGRVTDSMFAMVFPGGGDLPRHPSQLYEATLEGALLFALLLLLAFTTKTLTRAGRMSGVFLIGYGIARSSAEYFREPDAFIGFLLPGLIPGGVTMGQLLCVPMIALGCFLALRRPNAPDAALAA